MVDVNKDMTTTDKLNILTSEIETLQPYRIPYTTGMNVEQAQPASAGDDAMCVGRERK